VSGVAGLVTNELRAIDPDTKEATAKGFSVGNQAVWIGWRSLRVAADVTISGSMTFVCQAWSSVAGAAAVKCQLWKRTAGGSDVDTLVAEVTMPGVTDTLPTLFTASVTPAAPVTVAAGERLLLRLFVLRQSADFDTATFSVRYDGTASATSYVEVTETVTFISDTTILYLRRTTLNGLGLDLLPAFVSQAAQTAVTNTTAAGTEIPLTRTAGGLLAEWFSPRFTKTWMLEEIEQFVALRFTFFESATAANAAFRVKFFRRILAGAETLIYSVEWTAEMATSATNYDPATNRTLHTIVAFGEDDRLVARLYVTPASGQTMGGARTVTLNYDAGSTSGYVNMLDVGAFKAESDPDAQPVPSGLSTLGMGNGQ
jgi:hypothetical protein